MTLLDECILMTINPGIPFKYYCTQDHYELAATYVGTIVHDVWPAALAEEPIYYQTADEAMELFFFFIDGLSKSLDYKKIHGDPRLMGDEERENNL